MDYSCMCPVGVQIMQETVTKAGINSLKIWIAELTNIMHLQCVREKKVKPFQLRFHNHSVSL